MNTSLPYLSAFSPFPKLLKKLVFVGLCSLLGSTTLYGQVRLPRLISDSMVVQRDKPVQLWGWAAPGEQVSIRFQGKRYKAKTGTDGKWQVRTRPLKAGGPYTMDISATNQITLRNVLVGDVWLCAGQSNMVHYMELHQERYAEAVAQANDLEIRQFLVPTATDLTGPAEELPGGSWKAATRENIGRFSVVAYFFAKKLYEAEGVPIGLINTSVGGTPIEAWTSEEGLQAFPDLVETIERNKDTAAVNRINREAQAVRAEQAKRTPEDQGLAATPPWYAADYEPRNWYPIDVPGFWQNVGLKNLSGVVWYRREITVPASMVGKPARLALGRIVDADVAYVNGVEVGSTSYQYPQRRYTVPAGVLKPGKNELVVRVVSYGWSGGFVPDKPYELSVGDQVIELQGHWQYKIGAVYPRNNAAPPGGISAQNQPTALFNGMVAPLLPVTLKGGIWYQGESNAGRPEEYEQLQPAQIADWRNQTGQPDLPFLFVQLPNFMDVDYQPSESSWARLREAQLKSLHVPHTGMAVAIDLGEWNDIHPDNKKPVGDRLALAALNVAYGRQDVVYSGPLYRSSEIKGDRMVLQFDQVGSGLVSHDGEDLKWFAIAGEDKKFVWAHAKIEGNTVVVWSDQVPNPRYVRYAWADNPRGANLYNQEGLPASPFRTDEGK
ncbi:sialate O-acetylesterase [Catalinimonas alkaloidigena]|uniref:Sialate O-acetylesterase n=1 Tax=Catalinimonas alkaloidigena TaxID=1075417 RepID=A0A1G9HKD8_9BACT|nr:sialate O-acetylesterase [Catalinimonas alkaloidigena]SDL13461.1 sialate O-acetylesterase [Catalinimonas alkaloidigena]